MVTGQGWTPMGHFHLTEMSPVCTWVRLSCRGGNLPKRRCARMCVCVCACMCAHVCVCCLRELQNAQLREAHVVRAVLLFQLILRFYFAMFPRLQFECRESKAKISQQKSATFCLLISYINSSRIFHSIVHQSFIQLVISLTKPAASHVPHLLLRKLKTKYTLPSFLQLVKQQS